MRWSLGRLGALHRFSLEGIDTSTGGHCWHRWPLPWEFLGSCRYYQQEEQGGEKFEGWKFFEKSVKKKELHKDYIYQHLPAGVPFFKPLRDGWIDTRNWEPFGLEARPVKQRNLWQIRQEVLQLRAMELKHGRVAMLAVLGWFHVAAGYLSGRSGTENMFFFFQSFIFGCCLG